VDGVYDQWEEQAFYLIGDMSVLGSKLISGHP
jgi:hypothetical protein